MKRLLGPIALLILVIFPVAASAHQGNPNFRSEITSVQPAPLGEGLQIEVVNFDDHVRLANRSGKTVLIKGYQGEPYARILADGSVEVNLNSPAYYLNDDRFGEVKVPPRANAKARPDWKQIADDSEFSWHDHRSHYMSPTVPPQVKDESKETKIFDYTIPIEVGGEPAKINGTLTWVGNGSSAPVIPFVILGLAIIAAIGFWIVRRRRHGDDQDPMLDDEDDSSESGDATGEEKEAW
jgi:LPXTG-motif cell wall-anchored protein